MAQEVQGFCGPTTADFDPLLSPDRTRFRPIRLRPLGRKWNRWDRMAHARSPAPGRCRPGSGWLSSRLGSWSCVSTVGATWMDVTELRFLPVHGGQGVSMVCRKSKQRGAAPQTTRQVKWRVIAFRMNCVRLVWRRATTEDQGYYCIWRLLREISCCLIQIWFSVLRRLSGGCHLNWKVVQIMD